MNISLPNPAQVSDQLAAILQAVQANILNAPVASVTPTNGGSTTYDYTVVANVGGAQIPSNSASTSTGASTLSATAYNTISWNALQGAEPGVAVTYSVYRTTGGSTQGLIASGLTGTSFVDTGATAASATTPPFNTSGTLAAVVQEPAVAFAASGAVSIPGGTVFITASGAAALTLAAPIAGPASSGGHDGLSISFISTTAEDHTVTTPANAINGSKHVGTFGGAIGDGFTLTAYNGVWYVSWNNGVTLS